MHIVPRIEQSEQGLVVSSETLAEGTENQHKNVLQLIRTYSDDLEGFGPLESETRMGNRGGVPTEVFLLNEHQATLILTYMRNMKRIREFKIALVTGFYEMAQQLNTTPALTDDEIMHQALEISSRRIAALEPKAEAYDTFLDASGDYDVRDAAQILSRDYGIETGQKRLFAWLRENEWLGRNNRPYQHRIDQHLMRLKPGTFKFTRTNGEEQLAPPQVRVTAKGVDRIYREMTKKEVIPA